MKKIKIFIMLFIPALTMVGCGDDDSESNNNDNDDDDIVLVGQDGNPRFNLQFNNEDDVDLDLYVTTPNGTTLSYSNPFAEGGELDVDCLCGGCPQGPNENIFWENGTAPDGTYEYWVDYFGNCGSSGASSNFTIRVIRNGQVLTTKTGTLSSGQSSVYSHNQS